MPKSKDFDYGQNKGGFLVASLIESNCEGKDILASNPSSIEMMK